LISHRPIPRKSKFLCPRDLDFVPHPVAFGKRAPRTWQAEYGNR
jgi:hypothetical protein